MKILFIGGTGNISSASVALALDGGHRVTLLNRGQTTDKCSPGLLNRCGSILGDRNSPPDLERAAKEHFDVVADFVAFAPEQVQATVEAFRGKTAQYVFISSASVYRKPGRKLFLTEDCLLGNDVWEYARQKISCEDVLRAAFNRDNFPMTIVRPSYTYGPSWIPGPLAHEYTNLFRIRHRLPIISHGDGQSLWVVTSADDFARGFVGLFGNDVALGQTVHITSDEVLTWDQIHTTIAHEAGVEAKLVHIPSDLIARFNDRWKGTLLGDKTYSTAFDNSKIKRLVPDYEARISFAEGIRKSIAWYDERPEKQVPDASVNSLMNRLIKAYERATEKFPQN